MNIPLICIVALGLLIFVGGLFVSLARGKANKFIGHQEAPDDPLHKIVRAHANTAEYAPVLALLIYILGQMQSADWVVVIMVLATLSRYLIFLGLLLPTTMDKPNPLRFIGAMGTYIFGAILCVALGMAAL